MTIKIIPNLKLFWPLLLFKDRITDTDLIGKAMINVTLGGSERTYFENIEINKLAFE